MKKYVIMMIICAAVISMTMSASADNEIPIQRIATREVGSEDGLINEPIIEEVSYEDIKDDLIIAPNPDAVVTHNAEDGERTIDDTVILPDAYDGENEEEIVDSTSIYAAVGSDEKTSKDSSGVSVLLVVGTVGFLLIAFLIVSKKK